jgi:hypothetical protein
MDTPSTKQAAIQIMIDSMVQAGVSQEDAEKVAPKLIEQAEKIS